VRNAQVAQRFEIVQTLNITLRAVGGAVIDDNQLIGLLSLSLYDPGRRRP